ncbi:MAG: hypothetical protein GY765_30325, partial [bacterium]|nr:hypothetical protein [bacterium]
MTDKKEKNEEAKVASKTKSKTKTKAGGKEKHAFQAETKELLNLMKKSGCQYVGIAVETGSKRVLNEIIKGKPINFDHTIE